MTRITDERLEDHRAYIAEGFSTLREQALLGCAAELLAEVDFHRAKDAELYQLAAVQSGAGIADPVGLCDAVLHRCRPA